MVVIHHVPGLDQAEATVAELRAQLAVKPKPPRQRDAARIRVLESMTALLYDELQAEKAKKGLSPEHYFTQPNRAQRRAAERNRRRP